MFDLFDFISGIAVHLSSWRIWLCLLLAIGIVVGLHFKYPEQDGLWSVSYPAAIVIIAFGFWWEHRANR